MMRRAVLVTLLVLAIFTPSIIAAPGDYVDTSEEDMEEEIIIRDDGTSTEGEKGGPGAREGGRGSTRGPKWRRELNITFGGGGCFWVFVQVGEDGRCQRGREPDRGG
jgi:hypothetical protein